MPRSLSHAVLCSPPSPFHEWTPNRSLKARGVHGINLLGQRTGGKDRWRMDPREGWGTWRTNGLECHQCSYRHKQHLFPVMATGNIVKQQLTVGIYTQLLNFLLLCNKSLQNIMAENHQCLSHPISKGQEPGSGLAGCFRIRVSCETAVKSSARAAGT